MWKKIKSIVPIVLLCVSLPFLVFEFLGALKWILLALWNFLKFSTPGKKDLLVYLWFFVGIGAFFLLRLIPVYKKNEKTLETFSHESTHAVVCLLFFRRLKHFRVGVGDGSIAHSAGGPGSVFIKLSPYFLPVLTFFFLLMRLFGDPDSLYFFDILVGLTLAFHGRCFATQTGSYQTDISEVGTKKAYLLIACALLFNLTVILLSIRMGLLKANATLFANYWRDIVAVVKFIF